ncbi:MAG: tetratricopeptide repeat protein [Anaerolineae bacterium]|jgi:tetratricopeptide (TPR) repeat protein|nr:tetratricopeptide repeat protein [Anaerolineae bacterium]
MTTTEVPISQIDPQLRQTTSELLHRWEKGTLSYQEILEQMTLLKRQAIADKRPSDEGHIESRLGVMQGYRGNYDASIEHFERARELYLQAGNRLEVVGTILNIGENYRLKGNYARARQCFQASYEAGVAIADVSSQIISRSNEAQVLISLERYEQAETMLLECLARSDEPWRNEPIDHGRGRKAHLCEMLHGLAQIYLALKQPGLAWEHAKRALAVAHELNIQLRLGYANRIIGMVLTQLGNRDEEGFDKEPDVYFQAAIQAFRSIKADGEIAKTLYEQGLSLGKRGKKQLGARKLQQAMLIFSKLGNVSDAAKAAKEQLALL